MMGCGHVVATLWRACAGLGGPYRHSEASATVLMAAWREQEGLSNGLRGEPPQR